LEPVGYYAKTSQGTVYTNTALGFSLTFPANWYIPSSSTDSDPHAYGCPFYQCSDALEVSFAQTSLKAQSELDRKYLIPYEIFSSLVPDAVVLKNEITSGGLEWMDDYYIFFNSAPALVIHADGTMIMPILPSLRSSNK
jgi:hypothetical protein